MIIRLFLGLAKQRRSNKNTHHPWKIVCMATNPEPYPYSEYTHVRSRSKRKVGCGSFMNFLAWILVSNNTICHTCSGIWRRFAGRSAPFQAPERQTLFSMKNPMHLIKQDSFLFPPSPTPSLRGKVMDWFTIQNVSIKTLKLKNNHQQLRYCLCCIYYATGCGPMFYQRRTPTRDAMQLLLETNWNNNLRLYVQPTSQNCVPKHKFTQKKHDL